MGANRRSDDRRDCSTNKAADATKDVPSSIGFFIIISLAATVYAITVAIGDYRVVFPPRHSWKAGWKYRMIHCILLGFGSVWVLCMHIYSYKKIKSSVRAGSDVMCLQFGSIQIYVGSKTSE